MRFNKGSKIEVLKKMEVLSESWWPAEILSGNGHTYYVKYDRLTSDDGQLMCERVPRKVIRPQPPPVGGLENLMQGDLIEVCDDNLWKTAKILKVVRAGRSFVLRLLGMCLDITANASIVRMRQSWVNNQWFVIGKAPGVCNDWEGNRSLMGRCHEIEKLRHHDPPPDETARVCDGDNYLAIKDEAEFQNCYNASSKSKKRGLQSCAVDTKPHMRAPQKLSLIEKYGRCERWAPGHPLLLSEKVDAIASPGTMMGDNYMHASFDTRKFRPSMMGMESENPIADEQCFIARSLESDDACSVASCSTTSPSPSDSPNGYIKDPSPDSVSHFGDTESSSGQDFGRKSSFPTKEELAAEIHKLELHAYRTTLGALYASGPLSWEQEAMMTNLRLALHISNDEHLSELRHLVSSQQTCL